MLATSALNQILRQCLKLAFTGGEDPSRMVTDLTPLETVSIFNYSKEELRQEEQSMTVGPTLSQTAATVSMETWKI